MGLFGTNLWLLYIIPDVDDLSADHIAKCLFLKFQVMQVQHGQF